MQAPPDPNPYMTAQAPCRRPPWVWIVIGIACLCGCACIPISAAILFPVFAQARLAATKASCMSNVRRVGLGQLMYTVDSDDQFPPASKWIDATERYDQGEVRIYTCPAVSRNHGEYGYAMSAKLSGKKKSDLNPSDVLTYETVELHRNANGDPDSAEYPARHGRGRVQGTVDGGARTVRDGD